MTSKLCLQLAIDHFPAKISPTMMRLLAFLSFISCALAFRPASFVRSGGMTNLKMIQVSDLTEILAPIREPVQHQLDQVVPILATWNLPQPVVQWGHPIAMSSVIVLCLFTGMFFGIQIKKGRGNNKYWFSLGKTAREQHPTAMLLAFANFFIGATGGLSALAGQGKSVLESPHALTSIAAMGLMVIQTLTPLAIPSGGKLARKAHSALGMLLVTLILVNAYILVLV